MTKNAAAKKTAPAAKTTTSRKADPKVKAQLAALIAGTPSLGKKANMVAVPAPAKVPEAKKEDKPKAKAKAPSTPSTIESPVAAVHALCEKMKGAARKDVIAAAVAKGINRYTAATQYQRHRVMQKAAEK